MSETRFYTDPKHENFMEPNFQFSIGSYSDKCN